MTNVTRCQMEMSTSMSPPNLTIQTKDINRQDIPDDVNHQVIPDD